jgi:hypothetical protein
MSGRSLFRIRTCAVSSIRRGNLEVAVLPCLQTISNQYQSCDTWEGGYRRTEIERQKVQHPFIWHTPKVLLLTHVCYDTQQVLLKERKDELEARRKRIQTLRRAAKKGAPSMDNLADGATLSGDSAGVSLLGGISGLSGSGGERDRDIMDNDMDLNTETEVIRNHLEQLKK